MALATGHAISGSTQEADNLYQIEVIVFERSQRTQADDTESWPKSIELFYPENQAVLIDPAKKAEQEGVASTESSTSKSFSLPQDFLDSLKTEATEINNEDQPSSQATLPGTSKTGAAVSATNEGANTAQIALNAFLKAKHKTLNREKNALDRKPGYRILFHQTWLQALLSPSKAPALPIAGGNQYGDHHELEGYLSLSVSRYLHIESHLWLTEFVENFGQPMEHWPALPTPQDNVRNSHLHEDSQPAGETPPTESNLRQASQISQGGGEAYDFNTDSPTPSLYQQWEGRVTDPYTELADAPYLIKNIAVLQQKRKMRSGELHYIDHPKMGILIKIEPRTLEQAGAMEI